MTAQQPRVPAGIPVGGQFAATGQPRAGLTLPAVEAGTAEPFLREELPERTLLANDVVPQLSEEFGIDAKAAADLIVPRAVSMAGSNGRIASTISVGHVHDIWCDRHGRALAAYEAVLAADAGVPAEVLEQVGSGRELMYVVARSRLEVGCYLVDAEEYRAHTGIFPFVIDPDRHPQVVTDSAGKRLATNLDQPQTPSPAATTPGRRGKSMPQMDQLPALPPTRASRWQESPEEAGS